MTSPFPAATSFAGDPAGSSYTAMLINAKAIMTDQDRK